MLPLLRDIISLYISCTDSKDLLTYLLNRIIETTDIKGGQIYDQNQEIIVDVGSKLKTSASYDINFNGKKLGLFHVFPDTKISEDVLNIIAITTVLIDLKQISCLNRNKFLNNICHELKSPLNGIVSMSKMLKETSLTDEQSDLVEVLGSCNIQLLDIVNDILDYTKMISNELKLNNKPFSLKKCITQIKESLDYRMKDDLRLLVKYETRHDMVVSDQVRITQIMFNILNNSIKYTSKGEIIISVSDTESGLIKFTVKDTGSGIEETNIENLFNPFNSCMLNRSSVGLGLPITKYLVEKLGGLIQIESSVGIGTTITFTLNLNSFCTECNIDTLKNYFGGKYILVISNDEKERQTLFNSLTEFKVKTIACSFREMHMYLLNNVFNFEVIVISISDDTVSTDISKIDVIPKNYQKALFTNKDTKFNIDYIYNPPVTKESCVRLLSDIYTVNNVTTHTGDDFLNVLIASNDVDEVKLLSDMTDYQVKSVDDGLELFIELQKDSYDIAFINPNLQTMDGITTITNYKKYNSSSKTIFVAIINKLSESKRDEYYKAGMNGYISKPIESSQIKNIINTVIKNKIKSN